MLKIALTGSTSLVGSRLIQLLKDTFHFIPLTYTQIDITNRDRTYKVIKDINFDIFLHAAAYTNVDEAEREKDNVHRININGTNNVCEAVRQKGKKFIYISTDFVFDGTNPPYFEDSTPNPISYYGLTKYEGEEVVGNQGMIVRISYPYRASFEPKKDFMRTITSLLELGKEVRMVQDMLFTPTFIDDIAHALNYLVEHFSPEIYHLVGEDSLSPYEAGQLIASAFELNRSLIKPITYNEFFKGRARRSRYSVIKSNKNTFYRMKTFEEGLNYIARQNST